MAETKETFTKQQILTAEKYKNYVDVINALLTDDKRYSLDKVDALIANYMKGKVN